MVIFGHLGIDWGQGWYEKYRMGPPVDSVQLPYKVAEFYGLW